nr:Flp family type IVb pilin [uncultured Pseudogulbenkiania sp.]
MSQASMSKPKSILTSLFNDEEGVTSIEYALLGSLIAVVILSSVLGLGTNLAALFANVATQIADAIGGAL